jgi:hypothetical protein
MKSPYLCGLFYLPGHIAKPAPYVYIMGRKREKPMETVITFEETRAFVKECAARGVPAEDAAVLLERHLQARRTVASGLEQE